MRPFLPNDRELNADSAIMASGFTEPPPEKMPWLFGRWMRHKDWKEANVNATKYEIP